MKKILLIFLLVLSAKGTTLLADDLNLKDKKLSQEFTTGKNFEKIQVENMEDIKENIDEVLTLLSLSKLKEKHPLSLSGGQKQRLAVAVSMLCGKEILIFDEPTSGLDFDSMNEVGALIKRLAEEGKIIIIITHDREFIQMICSRVMVLESGKIRNSFKEDL